MHFTLEVDQLDDVGRVLDFSVIKSTLCQWLEDAWDHRMLIWYNDPMYGALHDLDPAGVVGVPFNPTAENMAIFLLDMGPQLLYGSPARLVHVRIDETRKCSAEAML